MKSVFLQVMGYRVRRKGEGAMEEEGAADLFTLERERDEARVAWQATHEEVEAFLWGGALPEKQELRHLLTKDREAHRAYIEAIRTWAEAKSSSMSSGEEEVLEPL